MGFGNRYNYFRDERYDGSPHRMSPEQRVRDDINGFQLVRTAGGGNGADDAFFLDGVRARVEQLPESDFKRSAQEFVARAEQIVRAETIEDLADPRDYLSRTSHAHTGEMRSAVDAFNDAVEHAASPSEGQAPVLDRDAATSAAGQDASATQTISSTDADPLGKAFSSPELTDDGARPDWPRLDPDPADPGSPSVADSQSQPDDGSDDGRAVATVMTPPSDATTMLGPRATSRVARASTRPRAMTSISMSTCHQRTTTRTKCSQVVPGDRRKGSRCLDHVSSLAGRRP